MISVLKKVLMYVFFVSFLFISFSFEIEILVHEVTGRLIHIFQKKNRQHQEFKLALLTIIIY